MKAFEERYGKNISCDEIRCGDMSCRDCKVIKAHVWRAALEWVLEHRELGHTVACRYIVPTEVIDKELEETHHIDRVPFEPGPNKAERIF